MIKPSFMWEEEAKVVSSLAQATPTHSVSPSVASAAEERPKRQTANRVVRMCGDRRRPRRRRRPRACVHDTAAFVLPLCALMCIFVCNRLGGSCFLSEIVYPKCAKVVTDGSSFISFIH